MLGNIQQGLGKAKNVSIIEFNSIENYNDWKELYPLNYIYNVQAIPIADSYKIFVVYLIVNT
jgi:hypothetical protein